jgi:hypothetical protein
VFRFLIAGWSLSERPAGLPPCNAFARLKSSRLSVSTRDRLPGQY